MTARPLFVLLGLALLTPALHAQSPHDYARGVTLTPTSDAAVQVLLVPDIVYQTATRPDLGDVRLFDASGTPVPFAFDWTDAVADSARARLPLFPLIGRPGDSIDALDVTIRRSASGSLVSVRPIPERSTETIRAHLIDASTLESPIVRLDLTWADDAADFTTSVRVESSDDLTTWTRWGDEQRVMRLRFGGDTLVRRTLDLPPLRSPYVRLTWTGSDAPPPLTLVEAVTSTQSAPARRTLRLSPVASVEGFVFDTGSLPIDRMRVDLGDDPNTLVTALLASAPTPDGPWTPRIRTPAYHIRRDTVDVRSPVFSVPTTDRYWRMETAESGTPLTQSPTLEVGWRPARLLFLTRGESPYTLAFGRAIETESGQDAAFRRTLLSLAETDAAPTAPTISPAFDLGGMERLHIDDASHWHRLLLWGALLLGVALLSLLAIRLIRSLPHESRVG